MTYRLSAPRKSGYEETFGSLASCRNAAADILHIDLDEMIEIEGPDAVYCYATQEDADNDDGAYAVQWVQVDDAL